MNATPVVGLSRLVRDLLARAATMVSVDSASLQAACDGLAADVTVVVSGRRGVGKSTLVNGLVGSRAVDPRLTAEDRPVQVVAGRSGTAEPMPTAVVPVAFLARRRLIELPDRPSSDRAELLAAVGRAHPDVLVHVTRQDLRSDELDLLEDARCAWALDALDVLVVLLADGSDPDADARAATALGRASNSPLFGRVVHLPGADGPADRFLPVRAALTDAERFVEGRRAREVLAVLSEVGIAHADRGGAELFEALEELALSPAAHLMRERWALEQVLGGRAQFDEDLRDALLALYLPSGAPTGSTAPVHRWQTEVHALPPLAAEVARVVVRSVLLGRAGSRLDVDPRPDPSGAAHHALA